VYLCPEYLAICARSEKKIQENAICTPSCGQIDPRKFFDPKKKKGVRSSGFLKTVCSVVEFPKKDFTAHDLSMNYKLPGLKKSCCACLLYSRDNITKSFLYMYSFFLSTYDKLLESFFFLHKIFFFFSALLLIGEDDFCNVMTFFDRQSVEILPVVVTAVAEKQKR